MALYFSLRRVAFTAQDFADASAQYCAARDASGEGASTFPCPVIYENRKRVARLSYNGRVWAPGEFVAGTEPLYCPSATAARIAADYADAVAVMASEPDNGDRIW